MATATTTAMMTTAAMPTYSAVLELLPVLTAGDGDAVGVAGACVGVGVTVGVAVGDALAPEVAGSTVM